MNEFERETLGPENGTSQPYHTAPDWVGASLHWHRRTKHLIEALLHSFTPFPPSIKHHNDHNFLDIRSESCTSAENRQ
jgi:hypothetical protein